MSRKYLWAIAHSYDGTEDFRTFPTEQDMLNAIREDFNIPEEIPDPSKESPKDSAEFWADCIDAYNDCEWQSYQAVRIDLKTGTIEVVWC